MGRGPALTLALLALIGTTTIGRAAAEVCPSVAQVNAGLPAGYELSPSNKLEQLRHVKAWMRASTFRTSLHQNPDGTVRAGAVGCTYIIDSSTELVTLLTADWPGVNVDSSAGGTWHFECTHSDLTVCWASCNQSRERCAFNRPVECADDPHGCWWKRSPR
jgi:hypothetical protein